MERASPGPIHRGTGPEFLYSPFKITTGHRLQSAPFLTIFLPTFCTCTADGGTLCRDLWLNCGFIWIHWPYAVRHWGPFYSKTYSTVDYIMWHLMEYLFSVSLPGSRCHWKMAWILKGEKKKNGRQMLSSQWITHLTKSVWGLNVAFLQEVFPCKLNV